MATALGEHGQAAGTGDPRYHKGMNYLQVGQWSEAIGCFEALASEYPGSLPITQALDEARWKAHVAGGKAVRAKRWIIPWRVIILRVTISLMVIAASVGLFAILRQIMPIMAAAQATSERVRLLSEAAALLDSGELDGAETLYQALLAKQPADGEAQRGLELVTSQRELINTYLQAIAHQQAGENQAAMAKFTQVSIMAPGYRDVGARIAAIKRQQQLESLLAEADADYKAGLAEDALGKYQRIREANESYQAETVKARLFELYLRLGRERIKQRGPTLEMVQQAWDYFSRALALQPRNAEAALESRLAQRYLEGQSCFERGMWDEAIARLRQVYDQRPDYLGENGVKMLYEAYIHRGDQYLDASDVYLAYEQYYNALQCGSQAPTPLDTTLAKGRLASVEPRLTPTPTSTPTPTAAPFPSPTATVLPTVMPTPKPLVAYRNRGHRIVFLSDNEEQSGFWVMDAGRTDGRNRQYLGRNSRALRERSEQYNALIEEARRSPDGGDRRYLLFVRGWTDVNGRAQIFMLVQPLPVHEQYGELPPKQLTRLSGLAAAARPLLRPRMVAGWRAHRFCQPGVEKRRHLGDQRRRQQSQEPHAQ